MNLRGAQSSGQTVLVDATRIPAPVVRAMRCNAPLHRPEQDTH